MSRTLPFNCSVPGNDLHGALPTVPLRLAGEIACIPAIRCNRDSTPGTTNGDNARNQAMIGVKKLTSYILALALTAIALPAQAHSAKSLSLGFSGGFLHPLSGPDHLLAMVSVGLWGAFLGRPLIYLLPVLFPTVMAFGGILGMAQTPMPPVEIGIAVSVLVLGLAIAAKWRAPIWAATVVVAIFGLFHGYAHGLELPSMANQVGFSLGFVLATGMLHVVGIGIGELCRSVPKGELVLRGLGGAVTLGGVYYLALALGV